MVSRSVVFPAPAEPSTIPHAPRGSENESPSIRSFSPYALRRSLAFTTSLPNRGAGGMTISAGIGTAVLSNIIITKMPR